MILTRIFIVSFICIAASNKKFFTFDPHEIFLKKCIEHHLVNIYSQYKPSSDVKNVAYFASRRFHGKSLSSTVFNKRYNEFFSDLRNERFIHNITKDQLSSQLRLALKQALTICSSSLLSADFITLAKKQHKEVRNQDDEWIAFGIDEELLSKCIVSHLILTGHREFNLQDEFTKIIANFAARKYYGKSMSKRVFYNRNRRLYYDLREKMMLNSGDDCEPSVKLRLSVLHAVEDCAINELPLEAVPTFESEPLEAAQLLNLILVKWPKNLRQMIQSLSGRKLLRRYASDARTALLRELNAFQNNSQVFRLALRSFWNNRAEKMFDANCVELPYISHYYTLKYPSPHMVLSDFEKFIHRKNINFSDRNPSVPRLNYNRILNIHNLNVLDNKMNFDISHYSGKNGFTSAEYYFENQMNQFYRIIFFFLELRTRGICTDEDDIFDGPLPYNLVPEQIQAIIYDDDAYRNYLLGERLFYKMLIIGDTQNTWINEENLVFLRSNVPSTSGNQSNTKSLKPVKATTENAINMTTQSFKRKDNVWKNKNGKCFPEKRAKTTSFSNSNDGFNENLETQNFNQASNSSFQENPIYFIINSTEEYFITNSELYAFQQSTKIRTSKNFGYIILSNEDFY